MTPFERFWKVPKSAHFWVQKWHFPEIGSNFGLLAFFDQKSGFFMFFGGLFFDHFLALFDIF